MKQRLSTSDQRTETILLERKAWLAHGQPSLAELQECVVSPEAMPMERNATAWNRATCPSPLPHCPLSSTEPGIACCSCTCRAGSSVPRYGQGPQVSRYHPSTPLDALAKEPSMSFRQNSAGSKLKNEFLACFLFHVYVCQPPCDIYGASTGCQVLGWQFQKKKGESTARELLTI